VATSIINPAQSIITPPASTTNSSKASSSLTSEDAFLKLLVSQIQHQDPLNPTDGVQFLTQLTSFSQLEQLMQINQDLTPNPASSSTASSSGTTSAG
jgi:flagellar basal-body rod modification protein FlgD